MENDSFGIPAPIAQVLKYAPLVAALVFVLWTGYKGYWYWGGNVRVILRQIETDRDAWREIALCLLRQSGIHLPDSIDPASVAQVLLEKNGRSPG